MKEQKNCAWCKKSDEESPRRRFSAGDLLGVCIACEKEHARKAQKEIAVRMADEGMTQYEVIYYKKILCLTKVWAKNKDQAKEAAYQREKAAHQDALHQFTAHKVEEVKP